MPKTTAAAPNVILEFITEQLSLLNEPLDLQQVAADAHLDKFPTDVVTAYKGLKAARTTTRKANLKHAKLIAEQVEQVGHERATKKQRLMEEISQEGSVSLDLGTTDWIEEMPATWPNKSDAKKAKQFETLLKQVKELQIQRLVVAQQRRHYQNILSFIQDLSIDQLRDSIPLPEGVLDEKMTKLIDIIEQQREN